MIVPVFNRYERKYILTTQTRDELIEYFKNYLVFDDYSKGGASYTIYNIYFDTVDHNVIRNSVSRPKYKDKLRLRSYRCPIKDDDIVFLEIKKKFKKRVNKRRLTLTYQEAMDYLNHEIEPKLDGYLDHQIFKEIDYFIKLNQTKPGAYIKYDRIAMLSKVSNFRVTFDFNLIFRNEDIGFHSIKGSSILKDKNLCVMEIKSEDNFPLWLAQKLSETSLYSQSFSKYGKAYENYLKGGNNNDFILSDD
jgi:hypothetical protein